MKKDTSKNPEEEKNEFFVGYHKKMPKAIASFMRGVVIVLFAFLLFSVLFFADSQRPFSASFYEYGVHREFEGIVQLDPYPMLVVQRPSLKQMEFSHYYLVAPGKHGAQEMMNNFAGQYVHLKGTLIYRDNQTMIEVLPDSVEKKAAKFQHSDDGVKLGTFTLVGEIVDSKCFFGAMNPGYSKVHKSCAIRCISGGIPPVFVVQDGEGRNRYLLLTDAEGHPVNRRVLDKIAEPLQISGDIYLYNTLYVLRAEPETYKRLN